MRVARDGLREISIGCLVLGLPCGLSVWAALNVSSWFWPLAALFAGFLVFVVAFFRDPERRIPDEPGLVVSPADGRVTEVATLDSYEGIEGPALRVSIFLSVFNVHINRSPCRGRVKQVAYQAGEFLDARHPECGIRNESNTLVIEPADLPGPMVVRQIAGLIARRIVCRVQEGDELERGGRFGLIKFGSRTELIMPAASDLQPQVREGDTVKGGSTVLIRRTTPAAPESSSRDSEPVGETRGEVVS